MNKNTVMNIETLIDIKIVQLFEESKTQSLKAEDLEALANLINTYHELEVFQQIEEYRDSVTAHTLN